MVRRVLHVGGLPGLLSRLSLPVGSVAFTGQGWIRPVYFAVLITHIVLAATVVPLALLTLYRAWSRAVRPSPAHSQMTWPIWMYVSVTGVSFT